MMEKRLVAGIQSIIKHDSFIGHIIPQKIDKMIDFIRLTLRL